MRTLAKTIVSGLIILAASSAHAQESHFFGDLWHQVTEAVSPSTASKDETPSANPAANTHEFIVIKDGGMNVSGANIATQATVDKDNTLILQSATGSSELPATVDAPTPTPTVEKKAEIEKAAATEEPSIFDDFFNYIGLGEEPSPATAPAVKQ